MDPDNKFVTIQGIPSMVSATILSSHLGTTDYLLRPQSSMHSMDAPRVFTSNESVWNDIIRQGLTAGMEVVLDQFLILNWFPRAPGLYFTDEARWAREEAFSHLHPGDWNSPVRAHGDPSNEKNKNLDYTLVFNPHGKSSMLQGGIGSIRLKPIRINNDPHWLMTGTSDGVVHTGIPLAIPKTIYAPLFSTIETQGAISARVRGELEFLPDPFSRLYDQAIMVPKLYVRVTELDLVEPIGITPQASVAVSFVSEFEGRPEVYASYVTFHTGIDGSFDEAIKWMKDDYIEGEYHGRIITDFDQTRTIFPEAQLALSMVMDRTISRGALTDTIEVMHAAASVEKYFQEVDRQNLLPGIEKNRRTKIFVSYAHAAEKETGWVGRIRTHLEGLARSSDIEVWDDTRIRPGERWNEKISKAIEEARVAVLVLTPEFLASQFIQETEIPLLLEAADADGATILIVYGSEVYLSGATKKLLEYQFVNEPDRPLKAISDSDREALYVKLCEAVDRALHT